MTLPMGFKIRVGGQVRIHDHGRTLVGGSPLRVLQLREPAPPLRRGSILEVRDELSAAIAGRLLAANLAAPVLAPPTEADLTVIVPTRDRADRLDRLLPGLAGLPVVVVDDASRDPVAIADVVGRHGADLVALTTNLGPGRAPPPAGAPGGPPPRPGGGPPPPGAPGAPPRRGGGAPAHTAAG